MSNIENVFEQYIDSVATEILNFSHRAKEYTVKSIFFGGGTPSVLPPHYILKLLDTIRGCISVDVNAEITIESNPKTIDEHKLALYKYYGINRLSIGVQSFSQKHLSFIGRLHNTDDVYRCCTSAKNAGFENINLDLIFCLPGQTLDEWIYTLDEAISISPCHISAYSLILEEGTKLYQMYKNREFRLNDEETDRQMYEDAKQKLIANGYTHYEISNFAKDGFECYHNLNYWDCGEYAGFGISAHSYFQNIRYCNTNNIYEYMDSAKNNNILYENEELIDENNQISEFMFLGLRKINGVSESDFIQKFGKLLGHVYERQIKKFVALGLLNFSDGYLKLTGKGIDVSNIVFSEFLL